MKRVGNLYEKLISDENILLAIDVVNKTHRWHRGHKLNEVTEWVDRNKPRAVKELKEIIENGYIPSYYKTMRRWDVGARKWREITEPKQYPDQYIHHMLIQVLQPVMMRGMDPYCCGSIRTRGVHYAHHYLQQWIRKDINGTKYCLSIDIRHFYDNLTQEEVMNRMRSLVKDRRVLDLIERVTSDGVKIGAYPSQWFANTTLQPLDTLIRQSGLCKHYVRYMDNFTILGDDKQNLHRLKRLIEEWLNNRDLEIKSNWQVFLVADDAKSRGRLVDAVGYRFGRTFTLPRKNTLLRAKRVFNRYRKRIKEHKPITPRMAMGMLSRTGVYKHCNNVNIYKELFKGRRVMKHLKLIIRLSRKKIPDKPMVIIDIKQGVAMAIDDLENYNIA